MLGTLEYSVEVEDEEQLHRLRQLGHEFLAEHVKVGRSSAGKEQAEPPVRDDG